VRVRDTIRLGTTPLRVPLRFTVAVEATLPLAQTIHVTGKVDVPLNQHLRVPVRQALTASLPERIPVAVKLEGKLPALLDAKLEARIAVREKLHASIAPLRLDVSSVSIERRSRSLSEAMR
jgi:hypothetical protein